MRDFIYRGRKIKRIGLFGLGRSSLGVKEYLEREFPGLEYVLRCDREVSSEGFDCVRCGSDAYGEPYEDVVFLSPAVRRDREGFARMARAGVLLSSDAELFLEKTEIPMFAVSGSDGKSTTVTLAARMLDTVAVGNIGVAMSPLLSDGGVKCAVAELSSFQLLWQTPRVHRAVITNISPNHLDWHKSYDEYIGAKENLLFNAEERVFNLECEVSRGLLRAHKPWAVYSSKMSPKELISAAKAEVYVGLRGDYIEANGAKILHTGAIQLKTEHNLNNILCAIALTHGHTDEGRIERVARGFQGLSHRCECVGIYGGVKYVNSSIDSTPKRCATTLNSLEGRWVVILGGRSKGLDYGELIEPMRARARFAVATGECGKEIADVLRAGGIECVYESDFDTAVRTAKREARVGEGVILSPASTSFDRFSSFEERGNYFKDLIRNLHNED